MFKCKKFILSYLTNRKEFLIVNYCCRQNIIRLTLHLNFMLKVNFDLSKFTKNALIYMSLILLLESCIKEKL